MRLALGTVQFGIPYGIANSRGQVSVDDARDIIKRCRGAGINTIDTAIAYGDSELCLGKIGVEDFNIVTKIPHIPDSIIDIEEWVISQVTHSIQRLNVKSLYAVMLHSPDQLLSENGIKILHALYNLRERGLTKKIGFSCYSVDELEGLFELGSFDIIQIPFNLVDKRLIDSGWLKKLKEKEIEVHTRSSFMQGLLLMPRKEIPKKFEKWDDIWDRWHDWLENNSVSSIEACLSYCLSVTQIDRVVIGVDTPSQLDQIISAVNRGGVHSYPNLRSSDIDLLNPANWSTL